MCASPTNVPGGSSAMNKFGFALVLVVVVVVVVLLLASAVVRFAPVDVDVLNLNGLGSAGGTGTLGFFDSSGSNKATWWSAASCAEAPLPTS